MTTTKRVIIIISILLVCIIAGVGAWIILVARGDQSQESDINQDTITLEDLNSSHNNDVKSTTEDSTADNATTQNKITTLSRGTFNRIDAVHFGSGDISLVQQGERYFIKFESSFNVANGPDLYVYLAEPQEFKDTVNGVDTAKTLNIGRLKSESGEQLYGITEEQYNQYNGAVVIWCRAFGIQFSRADLM